MNKFFTRLPSQVPAYTLNRKYNYLYSEKELKPCIEKLDQIREQTKILRIYFNNHYGRKAVVNAMQFKEMNVMSLSTDERRVLERAQTYIA